jgi:radical SAM protein with 4Fe4S-binding SPASM domain
MSPPASAPVPAIAKPPGILSRLRKGLKTTLNLPRLWRKYQTGVVDLIGAYPDRLYIEITNVCNLDCVMCPTGLHVLERSKGHMKWDLFTAVIDEMAPHVKTTTLHIWGEPLLHPRLLEMVRYTRGRGIHVSLSTNATLLTEEKSRGLIEAGLSEIYLCLDGMNAETYEAVRKKASFEETKANIERFIALRRQYNGVGPKTYVQIIEMAPTKEQTEAFQKYWSRPGVDRVNIKAFDSWGNQVKEINRLRDPEGELPSLKDRWHCPLLWYHCHVYVDGTVTCCDRDFGAKYPLGNVVQSGGVMKVWNGPKMQELRRKHLARDLKDVPPCRACTEWSWWKPGPFTARGNAPADR